MKLEEMNPLLKSWKREEYIGFFVLIPLLLTSIYFVPQEIKDSYFILFPRSPSINSMFLSSYTHSDFEHFAGNLVSYFIIMFLLFNVEVNKKMFYRMALLMFIFLPIPLSLISTIVFLRFGNIPIQGFSGILAGLIGYFLYSSYVYLKEHHNNPQLNTNFLISVLMLNYSITLFFHEGLLTTLLGFGALCFSIYSAYLNREGIRKLFDTFVWHFKNCKNQEKIYKILVVFSSILFILWLPVLIPKEVRVGFTIVNTIAHYVSYAFGWSMPLFLKKLECR